MQLLKTSIATAIAVTIAAMASAEEVQPEAQVEALVEESTEAYSAPHTYGKYGHSSSYGKPGYHHGSYHEPSYGYESKPRPYSSSGGYGGKKPHHGYESKPRPYSSSGGYGDKKPHHGYESKPRPYSSSGGYGGNKPSHYRPSKPMPYSPSGYGRQSTHNYGSNSGYHQGGYQKKPMPYEQGGYKSHEPQYIGEHYDNYRGGHGSSYHGYKKYSPKHHPKEWTDKDGNKKKIVSFTELVTLVNDAIQEVTQAADDELFYFDQTLDLCKKVITSYGDEPKVKAILTKTCPLGLDAETCCLLVMGVSEGPKPEPRPTGPPKTTLPIGHTGPPKTTTV